jgi:tetratricopeptide (TPR) repeat protein
LKKNQKLNTKRALPKEQIDTIISLYSNGNFQKTIEQINLLNNDYPNVPLLFNILGASYSSLGNLDQAIKSFATAVRIKPDYAEVFFNLGSVYQSIGNLDYAEENYKKAVTLVPNYPSAHNNLGNVQKDLGKLKDSIESLEWAVAYKADYAEAYNNLGNSLSEYGRVIGAIESYQKAISIKPDYVKAFYNLATAFKEIGDKKGFQLNMEKVVEFKPDWGEAQLQLSRVKKYKKNDPRVLKMQKILERDDLDLVDRIGLNFTLAHVFENLNKTDKQFNYLNEGNRLRKKELNYHFEKDQRLFSKIKEAFEFKPSLITKEEFKKNDVKPIFIVGMPRSGTSLVHQIIDSHNEVYGIGELNFINKFSVPLLKSYDMKKNKCFSKEELLNFRESYLDVLRSFKVKEKIIIDKMPLNFRHLGFIASAFPEAKIIHMKRDAMATCWSIYKYYFNGNAYSYNQTDLAEYYLMYLNLMDFWRKKFPNKIYDLCYEDLTSSQEEETKKLLKYCELDWDENCLNFHTNKRAVKTTSAMQVRQKMYQGSSEVWKKYEYYLKPLIKGLNYH